MIILFFLTPVFSCQDEQRDDQDKDNEPDNWPVDDDDDDDPPSNPYCKVDNEYGDLFCQIYERLLTRSVIVDDNDVEDYGDAMAYACALIFTLDREGMADDIERAFATTLAEGYKRQVERFTASPASLILDSNLAMEVYIGVLGLLVGYEVTGRPDYLTYIDDYFDAMLRLTDLLGTAIYYLPIPPYGSTTIKAGLASTLLHYPYATGGAARSSERMEQGLDILKEMDDVVWDEVVGGYRYLAWDRHAYVYQYSNVTAVQALIRAYRLTKNSDYLQRAQTIAASLEKIFSDQYGGYFSSEEQYPHAPHSGEEYIALSGQNYTIFADLLLFQETGTQVYLDRSLRLFDFMRAVLWVEEEGLCFHDIQHGNLADWYCTGCNWQFLYNMLLLDHVRQGLDLLPDDPI